MTHGKVRAIARRTATSMVTLSLVAGSTLTAQAQVVGINSAIRNTVSVRSGGTAAPRPAMLRQKVALKDAVQTAEASQLQMLLLDGSVFTIGPNARLTIDRFVYDPGRNVKTVGATVARGAFRFMSGRALAGGTSSIRTPIATIGIRGTMVDGVVGADAIRIAAGEAAVGPGVGGDPNTASLIILRGPGARTQGTTRPGAIDVVSGGRTVGVNQPAMAVYVPRAGAAPIGPFPISAMGLMSLSNLIFPVSTLAAAARTAAAARAARADPVAGNAPGNSAAPGQSAGSSARPLSVSGNRSTRPWLAIGAGLAALIAVLVVTNDDNPDSP